MKVFLGLAVGNSPDGGELNELTNLTIPYLQGLIEPFLIGGQSEARSYRRQD